MAFTFQINNGISFRHDEELLKKAAANTPELKYQVIQPQRLVDIVADVHTLNGFTAVASDRDVKQLPQYRLGRGEQIVIDFGDHQVGRFVVDIASVGSPMDAPLLLHLTFAEVPAEIGIDAANYDGWLSKSWIQEEIVHLDTLPVHLEMPRRYSFRYVQLEVKDTSPKWKASFSNPQVIAQSAVTMADAPATTVTDEKLRRIYEISVKTLHDCMQEVFEDGPKRDRRLWIGDLRLQALANYATFDDRELVRRCLYLFGGMTTVEGKVPADVFTATEPVPDDTFLFDYSLFFISTLADYEDHTADPDVLHDLYPVAKKEMELALAAVDIDGIVKLDDSWPVFIDWSNEFDKTACAQAVLIYALKQFIGLARRSGDSELPRYTGLLATVSHAARKTYYDEAQGLFVSGPDREVNIASQVWMVLAHVLNDTENHELMDKTVKQLFPVTGIATPYMYHHIVTALFEADHRDVAIQLMKDYWGKMIDLGADTFWEAFEPENPSFSPYGSPIVSSYCHAWSCTPAYLIKRYLGK